jgi:DNA-binding winged helix-turn-helix (wHTH) protein
MAPTWRFAEFELDPGNQVLLKSGEAVKLAPQPYKVLLLLVSRAGGLVRREELRQAVWGDDVTVDFEHGVNTCMRQVRAALGEDADNARIIETVPRVGYRLKAAVSQNERRASDRASRQCGSGDRGSGRRRVDRGSVHDWCTAARGANTLERLRPLCPRA